MKTNVSYKQSLEKMRLFCKNNMDPGQFHCFDMNGDPVSYISGDRTFDTEGSLLSRWRVWDGQECIGWEIGCIR